MGRLGSWGRDVSELLGGSGTSGLVGIRGAFSQGDVYHDARTLAVKAGVSFAKPDMVIVVAVVCSCVCVCRYAKFTWRVTEDNAAATQGGHPLIMYIVADLYTTLHLHPHSTLG